MSNTYINHTPAQMTTRKELSATNEQIKHSAHTHTHIRYMESMNYVLRIQDDKFVYVPIEKDGSYQTSLIDRD